MNMGANQTLHQCLSMMAIHFLIGAGFDNWLDAVDGSFCTFEGGDDPTQVLCHLLSSADRLLIFSCTHRMGFTPTPFQAASRVRCSPQNHIVPVSHSPDPICAYAGPESCGIVTPPHTVSVSYLQDESTVTPAFANRQCSEYAKVHFIFIGVNKG